MRLEYRYIGHIGTSNQRFRVNESQIYNIPQPQTTGNPYCYYRTTMGRNAVEIPIEFLKKGKNIVTFYCGPQVCFNFNMPYYHVYSYYIRVFYDKSKSHIEGSITYPNNGDTVSYYPYIYAKSTGADESSTFNFIAKYYGYDTEGYGQFYDWHYQVFKDKWLNTLRKSIFSNDVAVFDNIWMPIQDTSIEFAVKTTSKEGICHLSQPIKCWFKPKTSYVKMYPTKDLSQNFGSRVAQERSCTIDIPESMDTAVSAYLAVSTWSGSTEDGSLHEIRLNGNQIADNFGILHHMSVSYFPVNLNFLKQGENKITTYSLHRGHPLEVNWPGPALFVRFNNTADNIIPKWGDLRIRLKNSDLNILFENPFFKLSIDEIEKPDKKTSHGIKHIEFKQNNQNINFKAIDNCFLRGKAVGSDLAYANEEEISFRVAYFDNENNNVAFINQYTFYKKHAFIKVKYEKFEPGSNTYDVLVFQNESVKSFIVGQDSLDFHENMPNEWTWEQNGKKQKNKSYDVDCIHYKGFAILCTENVSEKFGVIRLMPINTALTEGITGFKISREQGIETFFSSEPRTEESKPITGYLYFF